MDTDDTDGPPTDSPVAPIGETVVYPISAGAHKRTTMGLAVDLVTSADGTLLILVPVVAPDQVPLSLTEEMLSKHRQLARYVEMAIVDNQVQAKGTIRVARSYEQAVGAAAENYDASAVLIEHEETAGLVSSLLGSTFYTLGESVDCPVISVTGAANLTTPASILLAVAGGPHSKAAADVAGALAEPNNAWIDIFHALEGDDPAEHDRANRVVSDAREQLGAYDRVDSWIEKTPDAAEEIVEQSQYYDLTVLGAPQKGRLRQFVFGSTPETVRERGDGTIVVVAAGTPNAP